MITVGQCQQFLAPPRWVCNRRCLFVCLSVCLLATLRKNVRTDLHEIFREGWQWASEQMTKFWWRSGSPSGYSGYTDCFSDLSLLGDTESGINRLRCATLQRRYALAGIAIATTTSLSHRPTTDSHDRRALAEVCTVPVLLV